MFKFINRFVKTIDRYIIGKYLSTFAFTLSIFLVIIVVFDVSEHLDDFLKTQAPLRAVVFQYYGGYLPYYANILFPLINFLAVIFFTAKMANQTEIVPILSGKVSFNRFLWPYFLASSILFVIFFFGNIYFIPFTNNLSVTFERTYNNSNDPTLKEVHMQLDKRTFIYLQNYDNIVHKGYNFTLEKFDGDEMKEKLTAQSIVYDSLKHVWSIQDFQVRYVNGLKEQWVTGSKKDTVLDMRPSDFEEQRDINTNIYRAMSTSELSKAIEKEKIRGTGRLVDLELELYHRFISPFSCYVLTLIGVSLSSRKVRGGIGLPLGIGIFMCFLYIVVDRFASVFSLKANLPPIIAAFVPNVVFGLLGYYLLRKAPK
ncbi:LptF/LptG family permease [Mucilaginibacter sp. Bleaf8]|uniref:LptF/LptG family permease n=1 Tax=Mucilaginibacter sp. Bleaf8 TaxID=2834430 RepID=UPI001BD1191F|nr:LptF/LptG family permease [Mucilaginibacter sp. Bleaf8]MBS7563554.1 LptF/LptG family permease [Mucilaginibacter sp. Bleaf8]